MKIALAIFRADPQRGGAERYTAQIAAALADRGHHVDILSGRFGKAISGVRFVRLQYQAPTRASRYLVFLASLQAHLANHRYDIVHAMLPVRSCDIYHPHAGMAKAALQKHQPLANVLHRKRRLQAQVEEELLLGKDKPLVLCLSDYVKGSILKHYPGIDEQLVKLFNAVDLTRFDPSRQSRIREKFRIAPDAVVVLMIAQHFHRKGVAELIAATADLAQRRRDGAPVVVVVGQDDPAQAIRQARRLGIGERIIFAGETDSPVDFYAAADFFVLPTRHDSCSLVALEALAMGLPVISTVFNGACEIMTDGQHGMVLSDPADVPALADAMARLLDAQTRAAMRQACLALRPSLALDAHIDRLETIYQSRRG